MKVGCLTVRRNDGIVKRVSSRRGFTLVELSLSMVFIAILSIIIVLVINGTVSSYSRGVTLNLVNTVGTEIMNEMKTAIHGAPTFKSFEDLCSKYYKDNFNNSLGNCKEDKASGLISIVKRGDIESKSGEKTNGVPIFGAICLGNYSYLWNSGYLFNPDYKIVDVLDEEKKLVLWKKLDESGNEPEPVWGGKLLKIKDDERWVCMGLMDPSPESLPTPKTYNKLEIESNSLITERSLVDTDLTYAIADDANNGGVAVYDLEVDTTMIGDGVLYSISMTLGTVRSGIHINAQGGSCATRAETENNFDYCAINKFNITALASGGTKK